MRVVEDKYDGYYLEIFDLPKTAEKAIEAQIVQDEHSYRMVLDILKDKRLSLTYTGNYRGSNGFFARRGHEINKLSRRTVLGDREVLNLTPKASATTIVHELRHAYDSIDGVTVNVLNKLNTLKDKYGLSKREVSELFSLITEQRAYARELEYIYILESKGLAHKKYTISGPEVISFEKSLERFNTFSVEPFDRLYLQTVKNIFKKRSTNHSFKSEYEEILLEFSYATSHPGLIIKL